ncbi:LacI family DNA-binding transcriptional regulator [Tenggerimyces flavus]|uniref:LacI family DNA-binding transcriptional regulator n=1 Tax=Tenggerimyces flavus TaxID=1708749 RepID=A0ABV7YPK6_9ACTN|nr:LacI family DNA-binding transcriptional regulator [Tenggerimyces flavus]MBM7787753.1 LacI family transcriptional regulator [Tenggerimyces flavus]
MVTVHDVARHAGVSIATVSRALNDRERISSATRDRVLEIARSLGYQPNDLARSLAGMATQTIALLLPDITNPFFPELVKGVQTIADERGHLLLLCHNADDGAKARADIAMLRRKKVDGILLVAGTLKGRGIAGATSDLPTVVLDRRVPGLRSDVVTVDHRAGARKAVEHLLELGHRRIAHITGPPGISSSKERQAGWEEALRATGIEPDKELVVQGDFLEDGGYAGGRALIQRKVDFTAAFAANDMSAIGLLKALTEEGRQVPNDVSVVGFDGIHLAAYTAPALTTVAQPIFDLGRRAAELLLDRLAAAEPDKEPHTVVLETKLVVRGSTSQRR